MTGGSSSVHRLAPWLVAVTAVLVAGWASVNAVGDALLTGKSNGFVLAREADKIVDRLEVDAPARADLPMWQKVEQLSRAAIEKEPLATNAVRNLALALVARGDAQQGRNLMQTAARMSRRDLPTHFWLIQDYGRANDMDNVLMHLDQALRTKEAAWQRLIPALRAGLVNDELVAPTVRLLRSNPPWKDQFWAGIENHPLSLDNIADVLLALHEGDVSVDPLVPQSVINQLAVEGQFAKAHEVHQKMFGARRLPKGDERVTNADFAAIADGTLFDWTTSQTATLEAYLYPEQDALSVRVFGKTGGIAAYQVVYLPLGEYQFESVIDNWNRQSADALIASVTCNEKGPLFQKPLLSVDLSQRRVTRRFETGASSCRYHLLQLVARARDLNTTSEILLSRLSIQSVATQEISFEK